MGRWQAKLEHHQAFLGRIVDIGSELFAMSAACTRAEMLRATDPARGDAAYRLADAFCGQSRLRIRSSFDALWHNTDAADVRVAGAVLEREYLWLEEGVLDASEGTGPWVADQALGPSTMGDQRRRYR